MAILFWSRPAAVVLSAGSLIGHVIHQPVSGIPELHRSIRSVCVCLFLPSHSDSVHKLHLITA